MSRRNPLLSALRFAGGGLVDLLLPRVCPGCEAPHPDEAPLCARCSVRLLEMAATPYCPRCGASIGPNVPIPEGGCAACPEPLPRFAQAVRLGPYADPLRTLIRQLKYRRRDAMRGYLGRLLAQAVAARCPEERFDLVLPVPMHWLQRLVRGTDHASLLARSVGKELRLPVGDELVRVRRNAPQVGLSRTARAQNVRGAFAVFRTRDVSGARVLLVDDVTTTGATASEAARTLLAAGASRVVLAAVAKAEPPAAHADRGET